MDHVLRFISTVEKLSDVDNLTVVLAAIVIDFWKYGTLCLFSFIVMRQESIAPLRKRGSIPGWASSVLQQPCKAHLLCLTQIPSNLSLRLFWMLWEQMDR